MKPLASVSLDLDDLWSYLRTHGDPGWAARPSYLDRFLPVALDALDAVGLRITFFIVGADAARPERREALAQITARGHEVGNHSYEHLPWLHLYDRQALEEEIGRAERAIEEATGQRPRGFRGPGYSWAPVLLDVLERRGYAYDASTLPTFIGPLARAYYFAAAELTPEEREQRAALFGGFRDGLRPLKPYRWRLDAHRSILEIPVTTMPVFRLPFHMSYLLYLLRFSEAAAFAYLRTALAACRAGGVEPSVLLHPLDLLGADDVRELAFFPGMDLPGARKRRFFHQVLSLLTERFEALPMGAYADALLARGGLRARAVGAPIPQPVTP